MAKLDIIFYPDPRLKFKSEPITKFNDELKTFSQNMAETMYAARGIGLAAIQVAKPIRLLVIDIAEGRDSEHGDDAESEYSAAERVKDLEVFVNPEILSAEGEITYEEGCLSIPGVYAQVNRSESIVLRYQDLDGKSHEEAASGLKSIVLQHEIDHLNGVLFPERLGTMQRMILMQKYKKLQREKLKA